MTYSFAELRACLMAETTSSGKFEFIKLFDGSSPHAINSGKRRRNSAADRLEFLGSPCIEQCAFSEHSSAGCFRTAVFTAAAASASFLWYPTEKDTPLYKPLAWSKHTPCVFDCFVAFLRNSTRGGKGSFLRITPFWTKRFCKHALAAGNFARLISCLPPY